MSEKIANEETLKSKDYMGQYGVVKKIIVNKDKPFNKHIRDALSYSAYVTFASEIDAAAAIVAIDGADFDSRTMKASFGLSKYCMSYIKNAQCGVKGCPYVHKTAKDSDTFTKEEANSVKVLQKIHNHGALDLLARNTPQFLQSIHNRKDGAKFPGLSFVENSLKKHCAKHDIKYTTSIVERASPVTKADSTVEDKLSKIKINKWDCEVETKNSKCAELIEQKKLKPQMSILTQNTNSNDNMTDLLITEAKQEHNAPVSMRNSPVNKDAKNIKFRSSHEIIIDNCENPLGIQKIKKESIDTDFCDENSSDSPSPSNSNLKESDGQTSTLNTTLESETNFEKNLIETQIDNSIASRPSEYTALDKMIMNKLSETVSKLTHVSRKNIKNDHSSILNDGKSVESPKCERLKKIMGIFMLSNETVFNNVSFFQNKDQRDDISDLLDGIMIKKLIQGSRV